MPEMRRPVPHHDLRRHGDAVDDASNAVLSIAPGSRSEWKSRSTMAEAMIFDRAETLVEIARGDNRCSSSSGIGSPV